MSNFADALIDALGGTRKVSGFTGSPESTVSGWRNGLTGSRLNHLVRVARMERPDLDLQQLAGEHGVDLPEIGLASEGGVADHGPAFTEASDTSSPGSPDHLSQQVPA